MSSSRVPVLVFCRDYLIDDFRENFSRLDDLYAFHYLTDGDARGVESTRKRFYRAYRARETHDGLSQADIDDIVLRCRLLRSIDRKEAERRTHAIALALDDVLTAVRPQAVFCHLVDEYVNATLCRLSQKRGIQFVSYCYSFFPGKALISEFERGRPFPVREPDAAEIDGILEQVMAPDHRVNYSNKINSRMLSHAKGIVRHKVKRVAFAVKRHVKRDPLNMHYSITPYLAGPKRFRDFPYPDNFVTDWSEKLDALKEEHPGRKVVYIPLSYYPEATTNYWIRNRSILEYEKSILNIANALRNDFIVLIKEHVHMMGSRDIAFLRMLRDLPGVLSVHPNEFSNGVLARADGLIMGAGSAGVEAVLRDRPVFSYCDTSYWFGSSGASFIDLDRLDTLAASISENLTRFVPKTDEQKRAFLADCLTSTARVARRGQKWPILDEGDLRAITARAVARSVVTNPALQAAFQALEHT